MIPSSNCDSRRRAYDGNVHSPSRRQATASSRYDHLKSVILLLYHHPGAEGPFPEQFDIRSDLCSFEEEVCKELGRPNLRYARVVAGNSPFKYRYRITFGSERGSPEVVLRPPVQCQPSIFIQKYSSQRFIVATIVITNDSECYQATKRKYLYGAIPDFQKNIVRRKGAI
jgi:hypothetical protein